MWIGFEDAKKDPFKDKPALKPRQAAEAESRQKELSAIRSKSAKGTTSIINR